MKRIKKISIVLMGATVLLNLYGAEQETTKPNNRGSKRKREETVDPKAVAKKQRIANLFEAVRNDEEEMVWRYLKLRYVSDVNALRDKKKNGYSLLTAACSGNASYVVKKLLERSDIDVNAEDDNGLTPLQFAAKTSTEIVEMLLACREIHVNEQGNGESALYSLIIWYPQAIKDKLFTDHLMGSLELLLDDQRVDVNLKSFGKTPLQTAIECNWPEAVSILNACPRLNKSGE